jgi:hypothetical protein
MEIYILMSNVGYWTKRYWIKSFSMSEYSDIGIRYLWSDKLHPISDKALFVSDIGDILFHDL